MIRVAILGATGYTALELIKLLLRHPEAKITALTSRQEGRPHVSTIHPALTGRLGDDSFGTVVSVGKFYGSSASDLIVSAPRDNSCAEHGGRISLYAGFVGD